MSKEDLVEAQGTVIEVLRNQQYQVELENGLKLLAYTANKMRRFRIRVVEDDQD